jgi:hypothetical protein
LLATGQQPEQQRKNRAELGGAAGRPSAWIAWFGLVFRSFVSHLTAPVAFCSMALAVKNLTNLIAVDPGF